MITVNTFQFILILENCRITNLRVFDFLIWVRHFAHWNKFTTRKLTLKKVCRLTRIRSETDFCSSETRDFITAMIYTSVSRHSRVFMREPRHWKNASHWNCKLSSQYVFVISICNHFFFFISHLKWICIFWSRHWITSMMFALFVSRPARMISLKLLCTICSGCWNSWDEIPLALKKLFRNQPKSNGIDHNKYCIYFSFTLYNLFN